MDESARSLAVRLKAGRARAGLSQQQLAARSGMSVRAISDIERGKTSRPYPDSLRRLADALLMQGAERHEFILTAALHKDAGASGRRVQDGVVSPAGSVPRQLPAAPARFVGRLAGLRDMSGLLEQPGGMMLVTALGGMAGVGKTALALYWGHQVAGSFPDGQLYVNLRGFDPARAPLSPTAAAHHVLESLGVAPGDIPSDEDMLVGLYRSVLAGKRTLLVLDNAADAAQVRPLLPGSPACRVVVTSRSRLTGLHALDGIAVLHLDVLSPAEAELLLESRIGAERVAAESAAAARLAELCGHLPLALCIVGSRASARAAATLTDLVGELTRHRLAGMEVHGDAAASVAGAFSWSYAQLPDAARRMFRLLGIHPGPDISVVAAASLAGTGPSQARATLGQLAEASLLTEQAPGRFQVHDLLRCYAAERAHAEESQSQQRAAIHRTLDHYLHSAHAADQMLQQFPATITLGQPQPGAAPELFADFRQAMTWFDAEQHVLAALTAQAASTGFDTHAWQLPMTAGGFFELKGCTARSLVILQAALAAGQRLNDRQALAQVHSRIGRTHVSLGAYQDAEHHYQQALALCEELGDPWEPACAHLGLSFLRNHQGRYRDALRHASRTVALTQSPDDRAVRAVALNTLGWCHAHLGEYRQALAYCQQAIGMLQELGDRYHEAAAWDSLGYTQHHLGQRAEAISSYQQALTLYRQTNARLDEAVSLGNLGDVHETDGEPQFATQAWQQALAILDELDHPDAQDIRGKLQRTIPALVGLAYAQRDIDPWRSHG